MQNSKRKQSITPILYPVAIITGMGMSVAVEHPIDLPPKPFATCARMRHPFQTATDNSRGTAELVEHCSWTLLGTCGTPLTKIGPWMKQREYKGHKPIAITTTMLGIYVVAETIARPQQVASFARTARPPVTDERQ